MNKVTEHQIREEPLRRIALRLQTRIEELEGNEIDKTMIDEIVKRLFLFDQPSYLS